MQVIIKGMQPGDYRALCVDPWSGKPLGSRGLRCGAAGADLELPDFSRDIAIALGANRRFRRTVDRRVRDPYNRR